MADIQSLNEFTKRRNDGHEYELTNIAKALVEKAKRDILVSTFAVVVSSGRKTVKCIPFPTREGHDSVQIDAYNLSGQEYSKDSVVLVIFTDRDYRKNIKSATSDNATIKPSKDNDLHSMAYGVCIGPLNVDEKITREITTSEKKVTDQVNADLNGIKDRVSSLEESKDKATYDGAGNNISETYATKEEISNKEKIEVQKDGDTTNVVTYNENGIINTVKIKDGTNGRNGITFVPKISDDGELDWSKYTNPISIPDEILKPINVIPKINPGTDTWVINGNDTFVKAKAVDGITYSPVWDGDSLSFKADAEPDTAFHKVIPTITSSKKDGITSILVNGIALDDTISDGHTPTVSLTKSGKVTTLDIDGISQKINDGNDGSTFTPKVDESGNISWTNNGGLDNPTPVNIKGKDGHTPVVSLAKSGKTTLLKIDSESVSIVDGVDGNNGATFTPSVDKDGNISWTNDKGLANPESRNIKGEAGHTPEVTLTKSGKISTLKIDGSSVEIFDGNNGENGATFTPSIDEQGNLSWTNDKSLNNPSATNVRGPQGIKGDTPVISAVKNDKTTTISSDGKEIAEIRDGLNGDNGATFTPAVDADGNLSWSNDKDLNNPDVVNIKGPQGIQGETGQKGDQGEQGPKGDKGDSAFAVAVKNGYRGTEETWLASLKGDRGDKGDKGDSPVVTAETEPANDGDIVTSDGEYFAIDDNGTVQDVSCDKATKVNIYIDGQKAATISSGENGINGIDGKSAYDIAKENGYEGTEQEWLDSLKGEQGPQGDPGNPGSDGIDGVSPNIGDNGNWFINGNDTGVAAKGDKGDKGDKPVITTSKSGKTTTIYADGVAIGTVTDGSNGRTTIVTQKSFNGANVKIFNAQAVQRTNGGSVSNMTLRSAIFYMPAYTADINNNDPSELDKLIDAGGRGKGDVGSKLYDYIRNFTDGYLFTESETEITGQGAPIRVKLSNEILLTEIAQFKGGPYYFVTDERSLQTGRLTGYILWEARAVLVY